MKKAPLLAVLFLLSAAAAAEAWGGWKTLKTRRFVVFYKEGQEARARQALEALEAHAPRAEQLTGNRAARIPVVLEDAGDYSNGWSDAIYDNIHLFASPPRSGGLGYTQDWWAEVGLHETIHQLQQGRAEGVPGFLSGVFGNAFLPNVYVPLWVAEGIAVWGESRISPYQGRLNDGFYQAYLAACLSEGRPPSLLAATMTPVEFPPDRAYVFGGLFFSWLARTQGEKKFARLFETQGSSLLSYVSPLFPFLGIDANARKAYGKSLSALWKEWVADETRRFKGYELDGERLSNRGWYVDGLVYAEGRLYHQRTWAEKTGAARTRWFSEIVETDPSSGKSRTLVSTPSSFAGPLRARNGRICYAVSEYSFGWANASLLGFGLAVNVHEFDLARDEDRVRFRGSLRAFDVLPDGSLIGSADRKDRFGSVILRQGEAGRAAEPLFETDLLVDQIAADGQRVVAVARADGENFGIYSLDLRAGRFEPLVRAPTVQTHLCLEGDRVFFTANPGRVYGIFAYDFRQKKVFRATRGAYASLPATDPEGKSLFFAGLHSRGFDLRRMPLELEPFEFPRAREVKPARPPLAEKDIERGGYLDNLATLWPKALRIPTVEYSPDKGTDAGILLAGSDALGHFAYVAGGGYNWKTRKGRISIDLESSFFAPLEVAASARTDKAGIEAGIPLARGLDPGIEVHLTAGWFSFYGFERQEFTPRLYARLDVSRAVALLDVRVPLERKAAGSSLHRTALYAHGRIVNYLFGELALDSQVVWDPDNPKPVFPAIRGYPDALPGNTGASFTVEFSIPLLPLRGGIWNPTIYFEDVCVTAFFDAAVQEGGAAQASAGIEVRLEMKVLNSPVILFLPGVRGLVTREREAKAEPILELALSF